MRGQSIWARAFNRSRDERGSVAIEAAIGVPAFGLFVAMIILGGRVEIANQAGERLGSVTQRIGEIDGMNQSVATATEEQTSVIESLNVDINEINTLNQEGVENLNSTLRACGDLEQQASRLKHLVDSFRI